MRHLITRTHFLQNRSKNRTGIHVISIHPCSKTPCSFHCCCFVFFSALHVVTSSAEKNEEDEVPAQIELTECLQEDESHVTSVEAAADVTDAMLRSEGDGGEAEDVEEGTPDVEHAEVDDATSENVNNNENVAPDVTRVNTSVVARSKIESGFAAHTPINTRDPEITCRYCV